MYKFQHSTIEWTATVTRCIYWELPKRYSKDEYIYSLWKAIEGYQFQVGRYNIWMNYYAIFVGALFVALYSIWPKSEIETLCCACKPVCGKAPAAVAESQEWFLPLIISVLGWIASLCWYGALLGYRKWNEHWIKVVQGIEMVLNKDVYPNVYTAQPERPQKESLWKRIKNIFRCNKSKCYAPGFVSTQKLPEFLFFRSIGLGRFDNLHFISMVLRMEPLEHYP